MIPDNNKSKLILILVIILAIAIVFLGYAISLNNSHERSILEDNSIFINQSYPDGPTAEAKIDTSNVNSQLLGENDLGSVELLGPFGNTDSNVKIAYSIGMHPLESKVHKALFDTVKSKNSSFVTPVGMNSFQESSSTMSTKRSILMSSSMGTSAP